MRNNNLITGLEFMYTIKKGYDSYYEGFLIITHGESDFEIGDTTLNDVVIKAGDIDSHTVEKILKKLNDENFYSNLLSELREEELESNEKNVSYKVSMGLGCRGEDHNFDEVVTESVKKLHQYLKKEFSIE